MFERCVLGIDPGLARVGLAVVSQRGRTPALVWAMTIRTSKDDPESERIGLIGRAVREAIAGHRPTAVAVERIAWNRNEVSALAVARATGAVMMVAADAGLPVDEYGPNEVKMAVAGSGNADKDQVRRALERVHGFRGLPAGPDAADAAAVALTHVLAAGWKDISEAARR